MLDSFLFVWDPTVNEWESKFELLRLYKSSNGNTSVPRSYVTKEGVKLGAWVTTQRACKSLMPTTRISMLDSISFEWDPIVNEWESTFKLLRLYKSSNGNTRVPRSYVTKDGVKLGIWVNTQRSRQYLMPMTRISLLNSILFEWDPIVNEWENKFKLLQQYKLINGNTNVLNRHVTKEGVKLGNWVYTQRSLHRKNQLSTTRIIMLNCISFDWDPLMRKRKTTEIKVNNGCDLSNSPP